MQKDEVITGGREKGADVKETIMAYVAIARPEHWLKHALIIPGIVAAFVLVDEYSGNIVRNVIAGFASACLLASANYVINEWLDAEFDKHHPVKNLRPGAQGLLSKNIVFTEYAVLMAAGLAFAWMVGLTFLITAIVFLLSGIAYNVRPFRTKEKAFLDVITESFNSPLRLMFGWSMVSMNTVPPLSLAILYWLSGAFLMSVKRLAEYRYLKASGGSEVHEKYRKSFKSYTEESLTISAFSYAVITFFMLGVFLVKYRAEFVLSVPFFVLVFGYCMHLGLVSETAVQAPEKIYRKPMAIMIVIVTTIVLAVLSVVDIPFIEDIVSSRFSTISFGK